jgi:hypothetical protein
MCESVLGCKVLYVTVDCFTPAVKVMGSSILFELDLLAISAYCSRTEWSTVSVTTSLWWTQSFCVRNVISVILGTLIRNLFYFVCFTVNCVTFSCMSIFFSGHDALLEYCDLWSTLVSLAALNRWHGANSSLNSALLKALICSLMVTWFRVGIERCCRFYRVPWPNVR